MKYVVAVAMGLAYVLMDFYVPRSKVLGLRLVVAGLSVFGFFYVFGEMNLKERLAVGGAVLLLTIGFIGLRAVRRSRNERMM